MAESIACFETEYGVSGMVREKKIPMNQFLSELKAAFSFTPTPIVSLTV